MELQRLSFPNWALCKFVVADTLVPDHVHSAVLPRARTDANIIDVRFHDLRHTYASRLVQSGVPLYNIMLLMGHKSLDMVQQYAYLAPEHLRNAVAVLDDFGHTLGTPAKTQNLQKS